MNYLKSFFQFMGQLKSLPVILFYLVSAIFIAKIPYYISRQEGLHALFSFISILFAWAGGFLVGQDRRRYLIAELGKRIRKLSKNHPMDKCRGHACYTGWDGLFICDCCPEEMECCGCFPERFE